MINEISECLNALLKQEKINASPGLRNVILLLRSKQDTFRESRELWNTMIKVYPNYDI